MHDAAPPSPSRSRLAVAWVATLLAAPVLVQGVTRVLSSWTGEPHPALLVTVAAAAPAMIAGAVAVATTTLRPRLAWGIAVVAGALVGIESGAVVSAAATALIAGWIAAAGLALAASHAPAPRGRAAAVLWGILAALAVVQVARMSVFMADPSARYGALAPPVDFLARHSCLTSYVHGAALARRGDANIYDDGYGFDVSEPGPALPSVIDIGPLAMDTYEYPPTFLPLPRLMLAISGDFMAIRALWFALAFASFFAIALALARWLGGEARRRAELLSLAMLVSPPILITLYFGNFQVMAMAVAALAMLAISQGRTRSGAALLGFVIGAKIFPGILGVYLLAARRFVAAAWTAAFAGAYALVALALFGPRPFVDFFTYHLPRLASGETFSFLTQPTPTMGNLGVFGIPFKLRVAGWAGSEADAWALARSISWGYTLVVVAIAVIAGVGGRPPRDAAERARVAGGWLGLLALAALRSPFAPPEALIPVIWALALRAAAARRRREAAWAGGLWVAIMITPTTPTPATAVASLAIQGLVVGTSIWLALGLRGRSTQAA